VSELQQLLDEIAVETGIGVSLDDLTGQLVAYSTHRGPADDARVRALLERRSPSDVRAWERKHGVATAADPLAIPGNPELGMSPRICIPLVHRGIRTGLLYLIAEDPFPTAADAASAADRLAGRTQALAALLYEGASIGGEVGRAREVEFLEACRGERTALRLAQTVGPAAGGRSAVLLVSLLRGSATEHGITQARVAAHQVLESGPALLARAVTPTHVVALAREQGSTPSHHGPETSTTGAGVAGELHARLVEAEAAADAPATGFSVVRDIGSELSGAYSRALAAAQAAAVDPALGAVVAWEGIGIYQLLSQLDDLTPGSALMEKLEHTANSEVLLSTLEVAYDHPGGVKEVAEVLHLHRTSLYYRLAKIRELVGSDPLGGQARTELHLALKLRRWARRPRV
jgi:hypothetical protein